MTDNFIFSMQLERERIDRTQRKKNHTVVHVWYNWRTNIHTLQNAIMWIKVNWVAGDVMLLTGSMAVRAI